MASSRTTSEAGLAFIKAHEGFRARAIERDDGRWVIGYSSVGDDLEGRKVTPEEAEAALLDDLAPIEDALNTLVFAPMTQDQFDALVSLGFSIGLDALKGSGVADAMNAGRPIEAADVFDRWVNARMGGALTRVDALVRRRAAEKAMFLAVEGDAVPASSALVRAIDDARPAASGADGAGTRAGPPDPELIDRLNRILPERPKAAPLRGEAQADPVRMAGAGSGAPSAPEPPRAGVTPTRPPSRPMTPQPPGNGAALFEADADIAYVDPHVLPETWRGRWAWFAGGAGLALVAAGAAQMRSLAAEVGPAGPNTAWTLATIAGVLVVAAAGYLVASRALAARD